MVLASVGWISWPPCQGARGERHWQDSMTFSSAHSPCQLHREGRLSWHCQVIADPVFSNIRCRQCQHQLLGANSESLGNFQSNRFIHLLPQGFFCEESCSGSLPGTSQLIWSPCLWGPLSLWWWWRLREGGCSDSCGASGCWFSAGWPCLSCACPCLWPCLWPCLCRWRWWWWWWGCSSGALVVFLMVAKDTFLQKSSLSGIVKEQFPHFSSQ